MQNNVLNVILVIIIINIAKKMYMVYWNIIICLSLPLNIYEQIRWNKFYYVLQ